ncbi:hypothetical protein [Pontiella sulfatireligans]|uniref:Uroporphyrinogen decarboxylase (URO-D) domain-containing protein n=1 Tax=Pontiella sulfatireligans TaxID=2750658 RepID=A0A6C2UF22_9BACT|nr:hypothetical protein [Pontiella sulfatireligans]VGO18021.1 hypothetical protein SCARR_00071 [Pontiella sulfatireligans]
MLHDPSHHTPMVVAEEIQVAPQDKEILRELAGQKAEIGALPVHQEKARLWTAMNDLKSERPMVWINEICWNEMNVDDELTLRCEGGWAREQELLLRRELYQWNHLPGDMVVNPWIECPKAIHSTDFGIREDTDIAETDHENDVVSRHFNVQIEELADLELIKMPEVTHNEAATAFQQHAFNEVFGDIMPVKTVGQTHIWFTPWDFLIRWTGIENAMIGLYEEPELYHAGIDRLVDAWMTELDQLEAQKLLSLDNNNIRVGSGGYGYISELPGSDFDSAHVKPLNMWGCSNAQIFSSVSPEMHWDFAVAHDMRWMERWGVNYYGCCEPLDIKMDLLRRIPNLRKVSVSPWCNSAKIIEGLGSDYVLSRKPSPAILATDTWRPEQARQQIREFLDLTEGQSHVELIMKDISTVRHQPQRLWEWSLIVMEEAERYAG